MFALWYPSIPVNLSVWLCNKTKADFIHVLMFEKNHFEIFPPPKPQRYPHNQPILFQNIKKQNTTPPTNKMIHTHITRSKYQLLRYVVKVASSLRGHQRSQHQSSRGATSRDTSSQGLLTPTERRNLQQNTSILHQ